MSKSIKDQVTAIIEDVIAQGDEALFAYTLKYEGLKLNTLRLDPALLKKAYDQMPQSLIKALDYSKNNILAFHRAQANTSPLTLTGPTKELSLRQAPIPRVAIYAPGGRAAYPTSVLMSAIPAQVAGVKDLVLFTPPTPEPEKSPVLAAAYLLGITEVYALGGAQAIAAAAFGTPSIPNVDLVVGPGNAYVTEAKRQVVGQVGIDMLAGPTELMVICDQSANPQYVAADLLAQAEHDPLARLSLVLLNCEATKIKQAIADQVAISNQSPDNLSIGNLKTYEVDTLESAIDIANQVAPEHLSLQTALNHDLLEHITCAGTIFVGALATEALGDYAAGTNHVLPTGGSARFSSCLNVATFMRTYQTVTYHQVDAKDFESSATIANFEGLPYHQKSIEKRLLNDSITC